jgi:hypothetical protein
METKPMLVDSFSTYNFIEFYFLAQSTNFTILSGSINYTINLLLGIPKYLVDEFAAYVNSQ